MTSPADVPDTPAPAVAGVLLCKDLMFMVKITSTARELGLPVKSAGDVETAEALIREHKPRAVFVDLAAGPVASSKSLTRLQEVAGPETPFVAFGSHVDTDALAAAREAGCREVMPRSKFTHQLPSLIQRYLAPA